MAQDALPPPGHERRRAKRPVTPSLNGDLVRGAQALTPDLSGTVEAGFVAAERNRRAAADAEVAAPVASPAGDGDSGRIMAAIDIVPSTGAG